PKGEFAGIVAATLDPEYFTILLGSILYAPDMRASVNHSDGKVFLMVPDRKDVEGMDLAKPGSFYARHIENKQTASLFKGYVYATGDERMIAIRTVKSDKFIEDKPLMVAVSRDISAIFATWRREALVQGVLFGVLALAAVLGLYIYQRREKKFSHAETGYVAKLQESEERFKLIIENATYGIFVQTQYRFAYLNPEAVKLFGAESADQLLEQPVLDRFDFRFRDLAKERIRLLNEEKKAVPLLEQIYRKMDGSPFNVEVAAVPTRWGDHDGAFVFFHDITEHKQAEEKVLALLTSVQEEKNRLSALINSMTDEVWFADTQKRFTIANPSALKRFCLDPDQMIEVENLAKSLVVLRPDGSPRPVEEAPPLRALYGEAVINQEELVQVPASGEFRYRQVNAAPVRDSAGNIIGAVSVVRDITDRKQAEDSLKASEEKYRSIFENAIEGIFQTTLQGQFISANPAMARMAGYESPEELISSVTNIGEHLYVNANNRLALINIMKEKGVVKDFETQHYRKDGSIFWALITAHAVKDETGNILFFEGTFEDITSRKLAEESLQQTLEKLRKSLAGTIQAMSLTVETRDPYTAGHQRRVSNLARTIAQEIGLSYDTVDTIRMAGIIHDIGKISVPAEILSKPGKITDIEMSLIRVHSQSGYDILKDVGLPYPIAEIVLQHHERLDGSGYPQGLKGNQILLEARIISVADVVEAISSHRPYRPGLGIDVALEEIEKNKGILYDEKVVEVCIKLFRKKGFEFE
ncbi:MAG: PAS domain S-box protein, partial [Deltaproteobacteria bacterium]